MLIFYNMKLGNILNPLKFGNLKALKFASFQSINHQKILRGFSFQQIKFFFNFQKTENLFIFSRKNNKINKKK